MPLNEGFSSKGYFFLPDKPDEKLPGFLSFQLSKKIELELFGQFQLFKRPSSRDSSIILGFTEAGRRVTLLNCFEYSRSMSIPGIPASAFRAIFLFVGEHFYSSDDIQFDTCSIEYRDINLWLDKSGFEIPLWNEEAKEVTIRYRQPKRIQFDIGGGINGEFEFAFTRPLEFMRPHSKAQIEQRPVVKFLSNDNISFDTFWDSIQIFGAFLAVNYFNYPITETFLFFRKREKEDEHDDGISSVELFYDTGSTPKTYRKHDSSHSFLIQLNDYKNNFQSYISKWYQLYNEVEATIKTLTECLMERGNPMELHFLSIVQALENLHRRTKKIRLSYS